MFGCSLTWAPFLSQLFFVHLFTYKNVTWFLICVLQICFRIFSTVDAVIGGCSAVDITSVIWFVVENFFVRPLLTCVCTGLPSVDFVVSSWKKQCKWKPSKKPLEIVRKPYPLMVTPYFVIVTNSLPLLILFLYTSLLVNPIRYLGYTDFKLDLNPELLN